MCNNKYDFIVVIDLFGDENKKNTYILKVEFEQLYEYFNEGLYIILYRYMFTNLSVNAI